MKKCYISAVKLNVFVVVKLNNPVEVVLFYARDGVLYCYATLPHQTGRKNTAYCKTCEYPWLHDFLLGKDIGKTTGRYLTIGNKTYEEFKFRKEI